MGDISFQIFYFYSTNFCIDPPQPSFGSATDVTLYYKVILHISNVVSTYGFVNLNISNVKIHFFYYPFLI